MQISSKNHIQRFKQGRQIQKFWKGGKPEEGDTSTFNGKTVEFKGGLWHYKGGIAVAGINQSKVKRDPRSITVVKLKQPTPQNFKKGEVEYSFTKNGRPIVRKKSGNDQRWYYIAEGSTGYDRHGNHNVLKNGKWVPVSSQKKDNKTQQKSTSPKTGTNTGQKTAPKATINYSSPQATLTTQPEEGGTNTLTLASRGRLAPGASWNEGLTNALNTANKGLLAELEQHGWKEGGSVQDFQNAMYNLLQNDQLGYDISNINQSRFADNKWGTETQSMFNYLNDRANRQQLTDTRGTDNTPPDVTGKPTYTVSNSPFGIPSTPIQSLYRTDFNYTGSNRAIRDLGFNNYAGLQNFVRSNADHQFAKDLTQRFGNVDDWNQDDVENALGVRGTYRRGINGDYSDIMRSMASWAGTQNGNYDKALQTASSKLNWNYNPNFQQQIAEIDKLPLIRRQKYLKQGGLIPKSPIKQFKFLRGGHVNFMTEVIHPL